MPLNEVQDAFLNNAGRPHMETVVRILHELDTFVADYDAIQGSADALPEDATVLDDGRTDAPTLTGAQLKTLRDVSANMSAQINAATKGVLISKMVRALAVVLRLQ